MLSDPQTITVNSIAKTLAAVSRGDLSSTYKTNDGLLEFVVSHQEGKRNRITTRLNDEKIAADPLTAVNQQVGMSAYLVIDMPANGVYTNTEAKNLVLALATWLSESSAANLIKVLGGES
jgi:hypothetical protein